MNKFGIATVAVMALTGAVSADFRTDAVDGAIDGTHLLRNMGSFSKSQLNAMRGVSQKASALYSVNWDSDSNGASYATGNLSTAVGVAGQGGWNTYATGTGTNMTNYKINAARPAGSAAGSGVKAFQISSSSTSSGGRYAYQDLGAQWAARNAGDNVFWTEYQSYFSASQTSISRNGNIAFDTTGAKILSGMYTMTGASTSSTNARGTVFGFANYSNAGTAGNYIFNLSAGGGPVATAGGWTDYAYNFNKTTGRVEWFLSTDGGANYTGYYVDGAAAGSDVAETDFYSSAGTGNAAAGNMIFGALDTYATPAPGAAALVGLAGLMARRRRA
jgi:hypothetical protein